MPIRRRLFVLAFTAAVTSPAVAEQLSIDVYVKGTGDPVPDATVVLGETGDYASTDAKGHVAFDDAALPVHIKVLGMGYETYERDVRKPHANIYLYPVSVEGEGLEVTEERIAEKASKVTLSRSELRTAPGSHGDPLKVIESLPGVVSQGAAIYVRGSGAGDNGVWVNRLPLNYVFHWGDIFGSVSTINPDLVQDFNTFLGGFPAEYPDRLGGLLDVQLRPPKKDRVHQNYRVAVNEAAFLVEGPVQRKDSFYAAGRHSYLDVLVTPGLANKLVGGGDSKISVITVPRYYDAQALWRHELEEGVVDLQYFAAGDELSIVNGASAKTDPELNGKLSAKQGYQTLGSTWQRRWRADWESVSVVEVNYAQEKQTVGTDPSTGEPYFVEGNYLLTTAQPELRWRRSANEGYYFGTELFYGNYDIDLNVPRPPEPGDVEFNLTTAQKYQVKKTARMGTYAAYAKQRRQWGERFTTIVGLRYSAIRGSGGIDMKGLSPRASVEYQFNPKTRFTATWGRYLQRPRESYLLDGFGNPRLEYTEAEHRIIGMQYQWNPVWKIQFEAYHKPMTKLAVALDENAPPDNYSNQGSGEAYGVDLLVKREYADRKMGWLSYSWGHSTRRGADGQSFAFGGDQPHTLTAVWSQPLPGTWRRWEVGVKFQVHSGSLYTPIVGRTAWCQNNQAACTNQNIDESDPNFWFWRPQFAAVNSKRLPWFYMVDLRIDKPVRYNTWRMNYYVDIQNVTMAQNVFGYDYGENYDNWDNPKKATGIPFMIPFFGVEASF